MVANAARAPSPLCTFFIERFSGAACRVGPTETAFSHREPGFNFAVLVLWEDPAAAGPATEWGKEFWRAMQPFLRTAVYSNYLGDEGEARARAAYGVNYERLDCGAPKVYAIATQPSLLGAPNRLPRGAAALPPGGADNSVRTSPADDHRSGRGVPVARSWPPNGRPHIPHVSPRR